MTCAVKHTYRRVAAAVALAALAFYALLLPWHLTSQFAARLFAAEFGTLASSICGSGPVDPSAPSNGCPICKGLAAFQLVLEPAPAAPLPAHFAGTPELVHTRDDAVGAASPVPRSRGPPLVS
jgi:hypothetical protein